MTDTTPWRFLPHPDDERFDAVHIDTVERWKESELSGDEWRFSHVISFIRSGKVVATAHASSVAEACLVAAYQYSRIQLDMESFIRDRSEVCCQPGCGNAWTVLLHPIKRYSDRGEALQRDYGDNEVRAFCERHRHRGDCALDDADPNYVVVEERFPPEWETEQ